MHTCILLRLVSHADEVQILSAAWKPDVAKQGRVARRLLGEPQDIAQYWEKLEHQKQKEPLMGSDPTTFWEPAFSPQSDFYRCSDLS